MLIELDIPTLSVICVILSLTYCVGLALIQTLQPRIRGINLIALALMLLGVGFMLMSFGNTVSLWVSKILANSIISVSFILILHGVCLLRGYAASLANYGYYSLPVVITLLTYCTYFSSSTDARIAIMAGYTSALSFLTIYANQHGAKEDIAPSKRLLSLGMLVYAAYGLFRLGMLPFEDKIDDFMVANWVQQLAFLTIIAMIIFIGFAITWMLTGRLVATIYDSSLKDELTRLYNRRALEEFAPKEVARAQRFEHSLSVLLIDIDKFKQINDVYGHQAGDHVLRTIGRILRIETRKNDFSFRYGGEEFLVLLPETNKNQAKIVAEKLRNVIERTTMLPSNREFCTASFGVSELLANEHWERLIERADRALYDAKNQGRNRVVLSENSYDAQVSLNHKWKS
ncbi:GGDEF domain-containing protein [Vibrio tubiashii]|uniref:GGDEF domain-containing protein n=1 Tax=Vibrio tubiashii TaxID=29498 RepID=UPI001EFEB295|nr:GGDEF domain-containing protein [Vibrio tubiashii]MCG9581111.1 GGDEF domain-containing protein [Vibrio tubiashii]MCG9614702.1 GGDEF domain-containing protein [Vibrio tubiashii]MCG9688307.1 GGDEF domain-containing protein [Vibrio tubiashii]